jgi:hypothetical protein
MIRQAFIKAMFARDALLAGFCAFLMVSLLAVTLIFKVGLDRDSLPHIFVSVVLSIIATIAAMISHAILNKGKNQLKIKTVYFTAFLTILLFTISLVVIFLLITIAFNSLSHEFLKTTDIIDGLIFGPILSVICGLVAAIPGALLYILLYKVLRFDKANSKENTAL